MAREDYNSFRLHFTSDLTADFLEFVICRMLNIFHDIWASVAEEVDWCSVRHGLNGTERLLLYLICAVESSAGTAQRCSELMSCRCGLLEEICWE